MRDHRALAPGLPGLVVRGGPGVEPDLITGPVAARFDGWGDPLRLLEPHRVLVAHRLDQVQPTISAAEAAAGEGSWVAGFVAYEAAPAFDARLIVKPSIPGLPLAWFAAFRSVESLPPGRGETYQSGRWSPEISRDRYRRDIAAIRSLIQAGDTYQTNYTFRLRSRVDGDPVALYADLVEAERAGRNALLSTGRHTIVSASPELFFRWDGRRIVGKPMKGTVARGRWEQEDLRFRERLLASGKDRAENVMIVDLLRNDLGRIARFGSVRVERLFEVERFETVWQMTSTVGAETRPEVRLHDVFAAMFPCGSVTGAPKVRTMEIIEALEDSPRGVYCGAIGLLAPEGSGLPAAQFSVAIRTVVIDTASGVAEYGVGGGVVHDSTADREYDEAILKSRVLTRRHTPLTLLETMRWVPRSGIWLRERHLNRLRSSARYLGIRLQEDKIAGLLDGIGGDRPLRVRLLCSRSGPPLIDTHPLGEYGGVVSLAVDDRPIDRLDRLRFHKTTIRSPYEAAAARHPDADDVVLINDRGEVVETTIANLAVLIGGLWVTPPIDAGCLPGTYREELLELGQLEEARVTVGDLVAADEVAVINSVSGWRAAQVT